MSSLLNAKIVKQVEHYFGNDNLSHDKFFQNEMKKDHGWISMDILLGCNALKRLTRSKETIAAALENSKLVDVSDDGQKVRRSPEYPLPSNMPEYWQDFKRRTVFVRGFPHSTSTQEIMEFFQRFGDVADIITKKYKHSREFLGAVFVTFKNREEAEKFIQYDETKKFHQAQLVRCMQNDFTEKMYSNVVADF